jgi:hypothetical protein
MESLLGAIEVVAFGGLFRSPDAKPAEFAKSLCILKLWKAGPPSSIPSLDRFVTRLYRLDAEVPSWT